jgi:hypothetical protein
MLVDSWQKLSIAAIEAAWTMCANGDSDEEDRESNKWALHGFDTIANCGAKVDGQ